MSMTISDVPYAVMMNKAGVDETFTMDVYMPLSDEQEHPALMLVHGGGFVQVRGCTKRQRYITVLGNLLSEQGYVCFAPDYSVYDSSITLLPDYDEKTFWLKAAKETAPELLLCSKYIIDHAKQFHVDEKRIGLIGGSAGGMACHAACPITTDFRCFISLWGAQSETRDECDYPPTLLIHGMDDNVVDYICSQKCYEKLQRVGVPSELILLENAQHTCIDRLPEFKEPMLCFLKKYLG